MPFNWLCCIELITHLSASSNNILISGAAIDLSSLIVVDGKVCWDLYIDGLVVSSDGNLLDALAVAIKVTFWLVLLVTCSFKFRIFLQLFEWSLKFLLLVCASLTIPSELCIWLSYYPKIHRFISSVNPTLLFKSLVKWHDNPWHILRPFYSR